MWLVVCEALPINRPTKTMIKNINYVAVDVGMVELQMLHFDKRFGMCRQ